MHLVTVNKNNNISADDFCQSSGLHSETKDVNMLLCQLVLVPKCLSQYQHLTALGLILDISISQGKGIDSSLTLPLELALIISDTNYINILHLMLSQRNRDLFQCWWMCWTQSKGWYVSYTNHYHNFDYMQYFA